MRISLWSSRLVTANRLPSREALIVPIANPAQFVRRRGLPAALIFLGSISISQRFEKGRSGASQRSRTIRVGESQQKLRRALSSKIVVLLCPPPRWTSKTVTVVGSTLPRKASALCLRRYVNQRPSGDHARL